MSGEWEAKATESQKEKVKFRKSFLQTNFIDPKTENG